MDRQQIGLKLTLDGLGLPARIGTFSQRLALQKAIYLAQVGGVQLGYQFHWYLRGPYSPGLTRDAFALVAELNQGADDAEGWNLDAASCQRVGALRQLFDSIDADELPMKLELLASVHFLLQTRAWQNMDTAQLRTVLVRYGKNFSEEQIQNAVEELTRRGLCPASGSK